MGIVATLLESTGLDSLRVQSVCVEMGSVQNSGCQYRVVRKGISKRHLSKYLKEEKEQAI